MAHGGTKVPVAQVCHDLDAQARPRSARAQSAVAGLHVDAQLLQPVLRRVLGVPGLHGRRHGRLRRQLRALDENWAGDQQTIEMLCKRSWAEPRIRRGRCRLAGRSRQRRDAENARLRETLAWTRLRQGQVKESKRANNG